MLTFPRDKIFTGKVVGLWKHLPAAGIIRCLLSDSHFHWFISGGLFRWLWSIYPDPKERKKKREKKERKRRLWGVPPYYRIVICYAFVWVKYSSQSSRTVLYYILLTRKRNICLDSWSSLNKNHSSLLHSYVYLR